MDVILLILELAILLVMLATAVAGLLREAVAFAEALMAHLKDDR